MLKLNNYAFILLAFMVVSITSCDDDEAPNNPVIGTISDIVDGDPNFSTLNAALDRTNLDDVSLDIPGANITIFAPNNDAFAAAGITDVNAIDEDYLRQLLLYHVIDDNLKAADFADGDFEVDARTENGSSQRLPIYANNAGGTITLQGAKNDADDNQATVTTADITAVNGTIHIIDNVLLPPSVVDRALRDGRFGILAEALTKAGLVGTLSEPGNGSFTVFAPTDDAFAAAGITNIDALTEEILTDVLLYHVMDSEVPASAIPGGFSYATTLNDEGPDSSQLSLLLNSADGAVRINNQATVTATDIAGYNGIIHVIDTTLSQQTLLDLVTKNGNLSTLTSLVSQAGLVPTLQTDGPFTLFAPNNAAFTAALADISSILVTSADTSGVIPVDSLVSVLGYHVIADANVRSDALPDSTTVFAGGDLFFPTIGEGDDASVVIQTNVTDSTAIQQVPFGTVDIQATNGVIHIIPHEIGRAHV